MKCCGNNNRDEDNSPKTLHDKNNFMFMIKEYKLKWKSKIFLYMISNGFQRSFMGEYVKHSARTLVVSKDNPVLPLFQYANKIYWFNFTLNFSLEHL